MGKLFFKRPPRKKPFLSLPFAAGARFKITEGWVYSKQENKIHGFKIHSGIDFAARRGTPVLAAADGYAFCSYDLSYVGANRAAITYQRKNALRYKGKYVGYGLGNFVQIYHPVCRLYTIYGHLDSVAGNIPYFEPLARGDGWQAKIIFYPKIIKLGKKIKRGEIIGYIGDSGISWGYVEKPRSRPDPKKYPSWDETHTHFEVFSRDESGRKKDHLDPFGIYGNFKKYRDLQSEIGLWLRR